MALDNLSVWSMNVTHRIFSGKVLGKRHTRNWPFLSRCYGKAPFDIPKPIRLRDNIEQREFERLQNEKLKELEELDAREKQGREELSGTHVGLNTKTGEINGPKGPEPTRHGDWSFKGRVTDF